MGIFPHNHTINKKGENNMYIIAVKNIENKIIEVTRVETRKEANRIYNIIVYRYHYPTFTYYNEIKGRALQSVGGTNRYNGVDSLNLSDYVEIPLEPSNKTIEAYREMIFSIQMQEHISANDWELIDKYNKAIEKLKACN